MKKLLGVLFVAMLIAALLPVVAGAEIVDSGTCGNNLTWTLNEQGTLTISGTGAMKDYSQSDYVPWRGEGVKNAVLEDGVTSIGSRAFSECVNLASVTIPDGVTTIGEHAFDVCRSLTSITIPDSVTTIGPGAISGCWGLTSISIPKGVTSIGNLAFYCCLNLTSVTIPDSVTSIGAHAFYECSSLTSVAIPKGVTRLEDEIFCNCANLASVTLPKGLTAIGDYAFSACSKLMDVYYGGTEAEKGSLTIGSDNACLTNAQWHYAPAVVDSGTCGKNGDNLTWTLDDEGTLTISGTGEMKDYFYNDMPWKGETVKNAVIEDGVTSIGDVAFSGCSSLTSVAIPEGVTSIGSSAFSGCSSLTSVTIPEGVTSIAGSAFYNCSSLTSVTIPEGVTSIGGSAFRGCSSLTSVTIPDGVTSIGKYAFSGCSAKRYANMDSDGAIALSKAGYSFRVPKTNYELKYLYDDSTIIGIEISNVDKDAVNVTIPEGVTSIAGSAFYNCSSLTSVTIPEGVTSIGRWAFSDCSAKRYANMDSDGAKALSNAGYSFRVPKTNYELKYLYDDSTIIGIEISNVDKDAVNVTIPEGVTSIAGSAFQDCSSLTDISIPEGVTSIGNYAFQNCSSLTSISIPDSVTSIGNSAFSGCSAKRYANMESDGAKALGKAGYSFRVPETNYDLIYLYDDDTITGIEISNVDKDAISVMIPEGVTSICYEAFYKCSSLTSVTIPKSVTSIGGRAFQNCSNLTSVTIPEDVTSIGGSAFYNCSSLTSVTIPEGVTSIGNFAFFNCSAKRYANMDSDGAKALGKAGYSFRVPETNYELKYVYDDSTITGIEISNVDKDAVSVTIPEGVTSIGNSAFSNCSSLTSVTIPEGVTSIGGSAFYNCSSLTSVTIPEGVTSIGNYTFSNCSSLTSVTIPEGVTSIRGSAFSGCSSLTSVTIPEGVTSIGNEAFYNCSSLTSLTIPEGVTSIDNRAFYGCSSLTSVTIPEGVTSIGMWSFCNCSSLSSLTIPGSVTSIGGGAFCDSGLTSVTIPEGVTSIGGYAFSGCSAKWYANMNSDGAKALSQAGYSFRVPETNYELKYLYDDSTIIGIEISNVDKDAVSVTIPEGVTSIGNSAFEYCSSLTSISIPESVTNIGNYAFRGCSSLTSISIPECVKNIGDSAFAYSDSLSKILLPKSVESIGSSAIPRKTTIYCYEYTNADDWATENSYEHIVYIDGELDDLCVVTLPCDSLRLPIGEAKRVIVDVFPAVKPGNIVWTSSDPAVAGVEDGLITALAPGAATITATAGKAAASVEVTVYARATGFVIPEEVWFVAKESVTLPVTDIQPEGADLMLTWSSGDSSLIQVDENGTVTSNRPDNDVTITATTDDGISRQCVAHACYPVTAVEFTEAQITLDAGHTAQLTANVTARTQSLVNKLVTFTSTDESVVKVDENGNVTAMGPGTTTVTATAASGVSDSITVTVQETLSLLRLPADLKVIEDEAFMGLACEAVIIPEGCTAIGSRAFANCKALTYVRIPASVKTIAEDAFEGCDSVVIDRED